MLIHRAEIAEGIAVGPRIWATGQPVVGGESEHPWAIKVADAEQARHAIRRLEAAGADFVKILNHLPPDAFYALMEEARARKLSEIESGAQAWTGEPSTFP